MKKSVRKLTLSRETLRLLVAEDLGNAAGGSGPDPMTQHQNSCLKPLCTSEVTFTQNSYQATNCV